MVETCKHNNPSRDDSIIPLYAKFRSYVERCMKMDWGIVYCSDSSSIWSVTSPALVALGHAAWPAKATPHRRHSTPRLWKVPPPCGSSLLDMDHCGRVGATWEHVMTIEFMSLSSILEVFTWLTFMCLWLPMSIMLGKWEQTQHRWDALANMGSSTQALLKTLATVQSSSIPSITSTVALHATAKLWLDKSISQEYPKWLKLFNSKGWQKHAAITQCSSNSWLIWG